MDACASRGRGSAVIFCIDIYMHDLEELGTRGAGCRTEMSMSNELCIAMLARL